MKLLRDEAEKRGQPASLVARDMLRQTLNGPFVASAGRVVIGGAREGGKTAQRKRDRGQGPAALSNSERMRQMREKS